MKLKVNMALAMNYTKQSTGILTHLLKNLVQKKNISVEQLEHYWNNMSLKETKPTVEEKFEANIEKNAA
jgi:hypothetical protein